MRSLIPAALAAALMSGPAPAADPATEARAALALAAAAYPCDCPAGGGCVCPPGRCPCRTAGKPAARVEAVTVHLAWDGRRWSRWENGRWVAHESPVAVAPPAAAPARQYPAGNYVPTFLGGGCAGACR